MIFRKPNQFNMKSNAFEFTEKAIAVHGDRYDYEDVCYVDSTTKVNIFADCMEYLNNDLIITWKVRGATYVVVGVRSFPKIQSSINSRLFMVKNMITALLSTLMVQVKLK